MILLIMCKTQQEGQDALLVAKDVLKNLELSIHPIGQPTDEMPKQEL
jgi:hypothetical protein